MRCLIIPVIITQTSSCFLVLIFGRNAFNGIQMEQYHSTIDDFKGHPAYYSGPNGKAFFSTFSSGGMDSPEWSDWLNTWGRDMYFVPDFDDTAGFNTSVPAWWYHWNSVIDGVMSW